MSRTGLNEADKLFIADRFGVYDQHWQFYEDLLGTPFLADDVLCYCDGSGLYLSAFSFQTEKPLSEEEIKHRLKIAMHNFQSVDIRFIDIWGRFDTIDPKRLGLSGPDFSVVFDTDYDEDNFEIVYDLDAFNFGDREIRKKIRQNNNGGLTTQIFCGSSLTFENINLMEEWLKSHEVSLVHRQFFISLFSYVRKNDVYICEIRKGLKLIAFSIFAIVNPCRIVLHSAFSLRGGGLRGGDALFLSSIEFARERAIRWMHCGYSASKSLLYSKEKWGATIRSPLYRETILARTSEARSLIDEGRFLWRARLGR